MTPHLLRIAPLPIAPLVHFRGLAFKAKREFHVTLYDYPAPRGTPVRFRDEYMHVVEGRAQSIIRMCDVEGLGRELPWHVTLYTHGDARGIGIHSWEELAAMATPITDDELAAFLRESRA